ncbi:MAG: hypothetical protein JJU46_05350 [Balneolaceae bacterium]|nr:hypothetical protein [Balneolaceae bacterium]MCH8549145.1 hypothetical protein [Balneolaceae bacterium]
MRFTLTVSAFCILLFSSTIYAQSNGSEPLLTPFEQSGLTEHTTHTELVKFMQQMGKNSPDMTLHRYGTSMEERELLYALFSRPGISTPAEAHASGKPILVLAATVHGHNFVLRESLLVLIRELGNRNSELNSLLDEMIVLVVPSKNPDGIAAASRFNPIGADLNRDYMALDQPSMAAYIGNVINYWHPHLYVDGHDGGTAQFGGSYPYNLTYQGPGLAGADQAITALADREIFPYINKMYEEEGYRAFYWAHGNENEWYGGGANPRMGRNYGGLANTLSILFEHGDWHDDETAHYSGILAYKALLHYASDHGDDLIETIERARTETIKLGEMAEGQIPVSETFEEEDFLVTYQIPDPDDSGSLITIEDAPIIKKPIGTEFRDRPWAYVLPPDAREAAAMLLRHNIRVEKLTESITHEAVAYTFSDVSWVEGDNGLKAAMIPHIENEVREEFELPKGSYVIRTGQLLGRVVTHLLEPETSDNIFYWDRMTALTPLAELSEYKEGNGTGTPPLLPIHKIMEETGLPSIVITNP